jgi:L-asparaginase II
VDPIAVRLIRGDVVESVHRAAIAVVDPNGRLVASFGRPGLVSFMRSSAKPMQAVPLIESGAAKAFGFGSKEIAIATGSHNGEPEHTDLVLKMLERAGLGPEALRCGRHAPYGKEAAARIGDRFTSLHHNCSGKHAAMLAVCAHRGWDIPSYQAPDHPLQREILRVVAGETGLLPRRIGLGVDGCGVPNFAVPVRAAARAFARLMDPAAAEGPRRATLTTIRDAMLKEPQMIAGTGRLDTDLMNAANGNLIVKGGAEAFYGAGLRREKLGIAIKIEDGAARAVPSALAAVLRHPRS